LFFLGLFMGVHKKRIAHFLALFVTAFATSGCVVVGQVPVVHTVKPVAGKPHVVKRVAGKTPATSQTRKKTVGY
jgi:hypothetical protein